MTIGKLIAALVAIVLCLTAGAITIHWAFFPARPMFHNRLAEFGEKGPFRFWPTPPTQRTDTGSQELYVDEHFNILVVLLLVDDPEATPAHVGSGWTGSATFTYDHALFEYNGLRVTVDERDANSLILFMPDGSKRTAPLDAGQAATWYRSATRSLQKVFLVALDDEIPDGHPALELWVGKKRNGSDHSGK